MKKLMSLGFLLAGLAVAPLCAAETQFTWHATALNKETGAPIEGVKFTWTLVDKVISRTHTPVCVTNSEGTCEVIQYAQKTIFSGASVTGAAAGAKEGYESIADYSWREDGNRKFLTAKMTATPGFAEARTAEQAELEDLRIQLNVATQSAGIRCATKAECDKLFSLTEAYMVKASDMKIQLATSTTISTYNPIKPGAIGMAAVRLDGKGTTATVSITTSCNEHGGMFSKACLSRQLGIVKMFSPFVEEALR